MADTLRSDSTKNDIEALVEIYRMMRPGEPPTKEAATTLFTSLFFNHDRYDLSDVGRMILCENIDLTFLDEMIYSEKTESSISLNQYGFRGPEFSAQKSDNTYRIFVVGSSVAYGQHVLDKDTISTHLQNLFDEYDSELKIEVINAGFGNAWSKTEVKWIKENLSEFEPDLVIVLDGWTDVTRELVKNEDWDEDANIEKWTTRWNDLCEFGTEKGFDTIVTIQPILGSSNKIFTNNQP